MIYKDNLKILQFAIIKSINRAQHLSYPLKIFLMKLAVAFILGVFGLSVKASNFDVPTLDEEPGNKCF